MMFRERIFRPAQMDSSVSADIKSTVVDTPIEIVERCPSVEEFTSIAAAVGFKPHASEAVSIGLAASLFAVCAIAGTSIVGCGRVVGDGALHFYLTNIMVVPAYQRRGVGSRIISALCEFARRVPYPNTLVEVLPLPGLESFYERFGFRASRQYAPGMHLWLNERLA